MREDNPWISRLAGWTLAVYWLAMFAGTHYPKPPEVVFGIADKVMHFSGCLGLAFLLATWRLLHRRLNARLLATTAAIVIVYGALDEITQIPVGRDCEFLDWVADSCGAVAGVTLAAAVNALWRRLAPASRQPSEAGN